MKAASPLPTSTLSFQEYRERTFARDELAKDVGMALWEGFSKQFTVDFPSPANGHRWSITPGGWVGHVALGKSHAVRIEPKVPIGSLFQMLEYAYGLKAFRFSDRLVGTGSIDDFFSQLARLLAQSVLRRAQRGLFRTYESRGERLSFIRGRMDLHDALRRPHDVRRQCVFQENTADIPDNQILLWAMRRILRVPTLSGEARRDVQQAYRTLAGVTSLVPFTGKDCRGRLYNRLNADYQPLHALCGFFLDHTGPVHETGGRSAIPFLINMWELFEGFVAAWLTERLPADLVLEEQVEGHYDHGKHVGYRIDLMISEANSGKPLMVLDTKYKDVRFPKPEDVAQVVSYAVKQDAQRALLIYPGSAATYDFNVGPVTVTSIFLPLEDPRAGAAHVLDDILTHLGPAPTTRAPGAVPQEIVP